MFRHPLHPCVRWLMALPFCVAAPTPALAQVDLTDVSFDVTIARTSEGPDDILVEFRLVGTGITSATIALPSAPGTQLPFGPDGPDFVISDDLATSAELAALLPGGNYVLRLNNGAVTVTIPYARPAVPSPDIEQPGAGRTIPPGPLEVLFTACGAPCNGDDDSVTARLEDAAMNELASETLASPDDSWIPPDAGGDLQLGENLELLVTIAHTAVRQNDDIVIDDADDAFSFTHTFVQSDEVGFETGFAPPEGDFCVVVNDLTPPAGCSPLAGEQFSLLDTSGMVATTINGGLLDVQYTTVVDAKGTITGTATADLDDNGSLETADAIKGKLKGKAGELRQKLSFALLDEGLLARLKLRVSDELSIPLDSIARVQKASGNIGVTKIKEETLSNGPLPVAPQGWRVNFTIDPAGAVQNGLLTLDGGRFFVLEGTNKFNLRTNLSSLKLQTDDGIKIQLKKVELDDEVAPPAVVGGDLSYRILGQSGKASLPAP